MKSIIPESGELPISILKRCGGYYLCPKDPSGSGKRLGPLVGYAGRDQAGRQFVGDIYANFAKAERHSRVLDHFARLLGSEACRRLGINQFLQHSTGLCGAPEGGKALATALALTSGLQYIFPDKKVTAVATETSREKSELLFARHEPGKGEIWHIVEDICNNFSTTASLVSLIEQRGASVGSIICFLNRSPHVRDEFETPSGRKIPVIALVNEPYPEYKQGEYPVFEDVKAGNVVWKPKNEWARLEAVMAINPPV